VGVKEADMLFLSMFSLIGKVCRESCETAQPCLMV